jgi:hypothetical protein
MSAVIGAERRRERGRALRAWVEAGGDVGALADLDRRVARAAATDWPGRRAGPEPRQGIPDLDLPDGGLWLGGRR